MGEGGGEVEINLNATNIYYGLGLFNWQCLLPPTLEKCHTHSLHGSLGDLGSSTWEDLHPAIHPSHPRVPSGVWLLLFPWDLGTGTSLEARMISEGEQGMEVLLNNHHNNNLLPMCSISDPSAKSFCSHCFIESLTSSMSLPISQVRKQRLEN